MHNVYNKFAAAQFCRSVPIIFDLLQNFERQVDIFILLSAPV